MKKFIILLMIIVPLKFYAQKPKTNKPPIEFGNNAQTGKYMEVRGIKFYYETYGKGAPLLLIHGNSGNISNFKYQIPYFSKKYKVIAVDSRAQGKSIDNSEVLNYEIMADDFYAILENMKIDSAYVIGWSDGGINGLLLAMRHPEKVKKLAITGANLVPDSTAIPNDALVAFAKDLEKLKAEKQDEKTKNAIKLLHMMEIEPNINIQNLRKIKCPVLVMGGDNDIIKPSHTLQIFENIPKANLFIFPASGHATLQKYKHEFNQKVEDFFVKPFNKGKWNDWE